MNLRKVAMAAVAQDTTNELLSEQQNVIEKMTHYHDGASALDIIPVHREQIYPNELNKKYMKDVTDEQIYMLYLNIAQNGLWHNLVLDDDMKGGLRLISGEKRYRAICLMSDEEYKEKFPNGIAGKVIKDPDILEGDNELRILLECNVLIASGKPDPVQVNDLIEIYDRHGAGREEVINYLKGQLPYNIQTLERAYNAATAIPELKELYNEKKIGVAAMRILCQGKGNKAELQKECYNMIMEQYPEVKIDEDMASKIKKTCKGILKGKETESKGCVEIRNRNKQIVKDMEAILKVKDKELEAMSQTEVDLCIKEMEDVQRKVIEGLEKLQAESEKRKKN